MSLKVLILFGLLSAVLAFPRDDRQDPWRQNPQPPQRQPQFNLQGGGSPKQGIDLSLDTRVPVWQSPNGRHEFDATGQYSQHLGGRYGNSPPNWGVGGQYTFRF
ncbi:diptericin A-like [Bactrocera neohumeralis]|uniref:diptericin A-like n=1 Tax=Bactrocera neohumeralis TaxID=98809 RepID=UPI0021662583|nr:diptericin A-like [Bactrocera neohumeralis]